GSRRGGVARAEPGIGAAGRWRMGGLIPRIPPRGRSRIAARGGPLGPPRDPTSGPAVQSGRCTRCTSTPPSALECGNPTSIAVVRGSASLAVRRSVDPLELTQEGGPLPAGLDESARSVHRPALLDGLRPGGLRDRLQLAAAGQGVDLNPAGRLDAIHPHERLADGPADGQEAVIAQDEDALVAEVPHDAWPLADVR